MRGPNLSQILLLLFVLALGPAPSFSQMYSCLTMQGTWKWTYDGSQFNLSQDASGNITGNYVTPFCPGQQFPINGTINSGSFTFTVSNLTACPGGMNPWETFTGYLGQPGCNFAYGSWSNSFGNSGGFGQENAYPTSGQFFTKPVDLPTSESSKVPTGAQWDAQHGAPWTQGFAPNSPAGEFEGRVVYEYAGIGPGQDTCWFQGSAVPIFDAITTPGYGWGVTSKNTWGVDYIGWNKAAVQYYRSRGRAPCNSSFLQQLVIDAASAQATRVATPALTIVTSAASSMVCPTRSTH